jgi:hypothetical protein
VVTALYLFIFELSMMYSVIHEDLLTDQGIGCGVGVLKCLL